MTKQTILGCIASSLMLTGCASLPGGSISSTTSAIKEAAQGQDQLTVLSMTGGLCLVAGMALLVITGGRKGWYPVIGGGILVLLNYMVAKYDDLLFIPGVIFTGIISAAWTYKTVKQILLEKKK